MKVITVDEQKLIKKMVSSLEKYCTDGNPCSTCSFRGQCAAVVGVGNSIELGQHHHIEMVTSFLKEISV